MEKKKVLVVEDSYIIAEHLKDSLENLGYQLIGIAKSSEEAQEILAQDLPISY